MDDVEKFAAMIRHTTSHIRHPASRAITDQAVALYSVAYSHIATNRNTAVAAASLGTFGEEIRDAVERLVVEFS